MEPIARPRSLHARLVDQLRSAIVSGDLAPGSLHSVNDIAKKLEISRTPVREALLTLAGQGMVRFVPNRGVRIQETTTRDLREVFQLRLLLEVPAVSLVTTRMTSELLAELRLALRGMHESVIAKDMNTMWEKDRLFHRLILEGTGNERLTDYVESLRDGVLTKGTHTANRSRSPEEIVAEHDAIMGSMENGDARGAAAAMYRHIRHTAELLIAQETDTSSAVEGVDLDWTDSLSLLSKITASS